MSEFIASIGPELDYLSRNLGFVIWETIYTTVLSTVLAYLVGLPLGVLMVTGEEGGVRPLPAPLMKVLNTVINLLRSVPFLILMVLVAPLSRIVLGTSVGTTASIIPLFIAAFPFVSRLVESSLREMDPGVIEAAQSMGCSPMQIITKVMLPECKPSLLNGFTTASITILSYGAMAGAIGAGGLGNLALNYGFQRRHIFVMWVAVVILVIMVQVIQSVGTWYANRSDKRLRRVKKK